MQVLRFSWSFYTRPICIKFSGKRQWSKTCNRTTCFKTQSHLKIKTPCVSHISGAGLKLDRNFIWLWAPPVVKMTPLKSMDSSLCQAKPRSKLTPTWFQVTFFIHSTRDWFVLFYTCPVTKEVALLLSKPNLFSPPVILWFIIRMYTWSSSQFLSQCS